MLHRWSGQKDCISKGFVTNVDENDSIEGALIIPFSFGVLVKELVFSCSTYSSELNISILAYWLIKGIKDLNIGSILCGRKKLSISMFRETTQSESQY